MKSKAPLVMIEQVIMLLVFALAAALCLQAFVLSDQSSEETAARDRAAIQAQTAAETLKHTRGDFPETARLLEGEYTDEAVTVPQGETTLCITPQESETPLLGRALVTVTDEGGEALFTLPVAWQRGGTP